jgi:Fe-S cluster biogenesis protein NfuA
MPEILHVSGTPNPLARKFHADVLVSGPTPLSFPDAQSAEENEVAKALFSIENVKNVFMLDQVVTVNISNEEDWEPLEPEIKMILEEHLVEFQETAQETYADEEEIAFPADFFALDLELQVAHLERVLDIKIRPGLAGDGGGIQLMGIDGKTVYVYYLGACGTCPSSSSGTLNYISQTLKTFAHPEIVVELS